MTRRHPIASFAAAVALALLGSCAVTATPDAPRGEAGARAAIEPPAAELLPPPAPAPQRTWTEAIAQRWQMPRMRTPDGLEEGRFQADFGFEVNPDNVPFATGIEYGLSDRWTIGLEGGSGAQPDTLSLADAPGVFFDASAQYALSHPREDVRWAARLDVMMSDKSSFGVGGGGTPAPGAPPPTTSSSAFDSGIGSGSRVSFQPSLLLGLPVSDDGDLFAEVGGRFGDSTSIGIVAAGGYAHSVGKLALLAEIDALFVPDDKIEEVYLSPGIAFRPRPKIQIGISPAIGLTRESYDWRLMAEFTVRF